MSKNNKIAYIFILSFFLVSCGFKKINQDKSDIYLQNINIIGENRLAYLLKNNILLISDENAKNIYDIDLKLIETKTNKLKDETGKVKRYNTNIDAKLVLKNNASQEIIKKSFSVNADYKVAESHSETINNKKNASKNIVKQLTNEITTFIQLTSKIK